MLLVLLVVLPCGQPLRTVLGAGPQPKMKARVQPARLLEGQFTIRV
ncbi:MAG: hypothetical protein ACXWM8_01355 [Candidatus Limnocylindrales bacterium]